MMKEKRAATAPSWCSSGHSWQVVCCGCTAIGRKAAVHAGKAIAAAAVDLLAKPKLSDRAKPEYLKRTAEGYVRPIPADALFAVPD